MKLALNYQGAKDNYVGSASTKSKTLNS